MTESKNVAEKECISSLGKQILKALIYFDIFNYPLTLSEIHSFIKLRCSIDEVSKELNLLVETRRVLSYEIYFTIRDYPDNITFRKKGNERAGKMLKIAVRVANLINSFPYVRAVMISGSLSKGVADKHSDIDFFIITKANKLWVTRTLLVVFKKLFLFNSNKFFCLNYLIEEDYLQIKDQNVYTATEVCTLVPVCGIDLYERFVLVNKWTGLFFPNWVKPIYSERGSVMQLKFLLERVLDMNIFRHLNTKLFHRHVKHWSSKYNINPEVSDANVEFRASIKESKSHPLSYRSKILNSYEEKTSILI